MFQKRDQNRNFFLKNKKGQFFLIAAVIIIVVIVSVVTVSNYTTQKQTTKLYDLGKELGIESQNVLDYGTYSAKSPEEMKTLMEQFVNNYRSYLEQNKNIYFVFGNSQTVYTIAYQDADPTELACISLNPSCCSNGQICASGGICQNIQSSNRICDNNQVQCGTNCCNRGESCGPDGKCKIGATCTQGIVQCSACNTIFVTGSSQTAVATPIPSITTINEVAVTVADNIYQFRLKSGENFYFIIWQKIGGQRNVVTSD